MEQTVKYKWMDIFSNHSDKLMDGWMYSVIIQMNGWIYIIL